MNNLKFKISSLAIIAGLVFSFSTQAQERPTFDPKLTEVWDPVPTKITPGENNLPPSDAVILFEELGRALLPSPLFTSAVMAGSILLQVQDADAVEKDLGGE